MKLSFQGDVIEEDASRIPLNKELIKGLRGQTLIGFCFQIASQFKVIKDITFESKQLQGQIE